MALCSLRKAGSLSEKIWVDINGLEQGMFIKSKDSRNPVLLFVHGGPGMPNYWLPQRYPTGLEDHFTVVWWEQRGAGLSYNPDIPPETMTTEHFIAGTPEVTRYLLERFGQEKLYLMGHSWGSYIGIQATVQLAAANGEWRKSGRDVLFGPAVGLPLAALNVAALQMTARHGIVWQNPFAALLDALQPGVVEEVIYRFAAWGLLWLMLRRSLTKQAASVIGLLALLIHTYVHFDALLSEAPLVALGMGLAMSIVWGLPLTLLARGAASKRRWPS